MKISRAKSIPSTLLILCLIGLPQISETIYSPALPALTIGLKTTSHLVQWSLSIYFAGFALGVGAWGKISDHIGRKPVILAGLSIYILMSLLCSISTTITPLLIARFLQAFGISVGSVITQAIMRDCFSGTARNKIFSVAGMAIALAPAVGPLLGGCLTEWFSWVANFICLALMGSLLLIYTLLALPETARIDPLANKVSTPDTLLFLTKKMLLDKHIIASSLLVGGFNGILFGYYSQAPYIFIELFQLSASRYGILGIFMAIGVCLGSLISHQISSKTNTDQLIRFSCHANLVIMAIFSSLVSLNLINTASIRSILLIMALMMLFYINFGIGIPNILSKSLVHYQNNIGAASSIFGLLYYCWISLFVFGIGLFLPNSLLIMPLYFLMISLLMAIGYQLSTTNFSVREEISH